MNETMLGTSAGKGKGKVAKAKAQSQAAQAQLANNNTISNRITVLPVTQKEVVGVQALTTAAAYVLGREENNQELDNSDVSEGGGDSDFEGDDDNAFLDLSDILVGSASSAPTGPGNISSSNQDKLSGNNSKAVVRSGKMVFRRSVTMLTRKLVRELSESYRRCFPKPNEVDNETYESRITVNLVKKVIPSKLEDLHKLQENPHKIEDLKKADNAQRQRAFRERRRLLKEKEKILEQSSKVQELQTVVEKQQLEIGKGKAVCEQIQFHKRKRSHFEDEAVHEHEVREADHNGRRGEERDDSYNGFTSSSAAGFTSFSVAVPSFSSSSALIQSVPLISTADGIELADDEDNFSMSSIDEDPSAAPSVQPQKHQSHPTPRQKGRMTKFDPLQCATAYVESKYAGEEPGKGLIRQSKSEFFRTVVHGIYAGVGKLVAQRKELRDKVNVNSNSRHDPQYAEEHAYLQTLKDRYWLQKRVKEDLLDFAEILDLSFQAETPLTATEALDITSSGHSNNYHDAMVNGSIEG